MHEQISRAKLESEGVPLQQGVQLRKLSGQGGGSVCVKSNRQVKKQLTTLHTHAQKKVVSRTASLLRTASPSGEELRRVDPGQPLQLGFVFCSSHWVGGGGSTRVSASLNLDPGWSHAKLKLGSVKPSLTTGGCGESIFTPCCAGPHGFPCLISNYSKKSGSRRLSPFLTTNQKRKRKTGNHPDLYWAPLNGGHPRYHPDMLGISTEPLLW